MEKDIMPIQRSGSAKVMQLRSGSSELFPALLYIKFDVGISNNTVEVYVIRPNGTYGRIEVSIQVDNTTLIETGSDDMDSPFNRFGFSGLAYGKEYTFYFRLYDTNKTNVVFETGGFKRKCCCSNEVPDLNPYSDSVGITTVSAYKDYTRYTLDIECEDNKNNTDARFPYDVDTRNLFFKVCAQNDEFHPVCGNILRHDVVRWRPGTVYVYVINQSGLSLNLKANQEIISKRIDEWIEWMNGLTTNGGVQFVRGKTTEANGMQINVYVGTHEYLFGYNPDNPSPEILVYGGYWENISFNNSIAEARVKICCEDRYPFNQCKKAFEGIVFEELTECCGPGYDQYEFKDTLFCEIAYPGKTVGGNPDSDDYAKSKSRDENIIRILYSCKGMDASNLINYKTSQYGSGIIFNKIYNIYGFLSNSSQYLFCEINATKGRISTGSNAGCSFGLHYKTGRTYNIRTIYTDDIDEVPEISNKTLRYTLPSAKGTPYFSVWSTPECKEIKHIEKGFKITTPEHDDTGNYCAVAVLCADYGKYDDDEYLPESEISYGSSKYITIGDALLYGEEYDLYLYCYYRNIYSDWIYIGKETVAPMTPVISDTSHTDDTVSFSYSMEGTEFDYVYYILYKDGNVVATSDSMRSSSGECNVGLYGNGSYELKVYSSKNGILCVDSSGDESYAVYKFEIRQREYFYWSKYTDQIFAGGDISSVPYAAWNELCRITLDVCNDTSKVIPKNQDQYGDGFGLAQNKSFSEAINTYAAMSLDIYDESGGQRLNAERFNIIRYIIGTKSNSFSCGYVKSGDDVIAEDLIELQDKLNAI